MLTHEATNVTAPRQEVSGLFARITPEHIAYLIIATIAAVLRYADLETVPLNPTEAIEALAVWNLWQPGGTPAVPGSPGYFAFTAPLTQAMGFADNIMRIVPATFGIALVLAPWFIRHRTGRLGALITASLLALSPSLALASRTAGGSSMALFAGMLLFISWLRYQESGNRRWLYVLTVSLALGLSSAPLFFGLLLTLAVAWLIQMAIGPALVRDSEGQRAQLIRPSGRELRAALAIGMGTFLAIATTSFLAMRGLGSSVDLLAGWFRQFQLVASATERTAPFLMVGRYEVGLLLIGVPATLWAAFKERPFPVFCIYWAIGALLLLLLQPGAATTALLLTLPGYLLIGRFANDILIQKSSGWWLGFAAAILIAGGIIYLNLVRFARLAGLQGSPGSTYHLLIAFLVLLVIVVAAVLLWTLDKTATTKGAIVGILALLFIASWGTAWWLTRDGANDTRERWLLSATDSDIRLVVESLEELSWRASNSPDDAAIDAAIDTPILRWYLKDFSNITFADTLPASSNSPILITPLVNDLDVAGSYIGTDYGYSRPDTTHTLDWIDALRWWLFHQSPVPMNEERLILWLRADLAEAAQ